MLVDVSPRDGYTRYTSSTNSLNWSEVKQFLMDNGDSLKSILEQEHIALLEGRIICVAHF